MSDADAGGEVRTGDALELLGELPDEHYHAGVTDAPYGLAFMGESWDEFEPAEYQQWCENWGRLVKRVLKPGAHLIAFSSTRTYHRLATGLEDAGYEVRDKLEWFYGNGMPKGTLSPPDGFDGWNTTLKPACEPAVLARKPLAEDTVAANLREHGTGALNIDENRIPYANASDRATTKAKNPGRDDRVASDVYGADRTQQSVDVDGRHPPNVALDEHAAQLLDDKHGDTSPGHYTGEQTIDFGSEREYDGAGEYVDAGGPSRFFYCAKASKKERTHDETITNDHPTVKPVDLMTRRVRLVTAPGQRVLDPFAGSGTTGVACKRLGRAFTLIELDPEWADVARARCGLTPRDPSRVRPGDDAQQGLESFTGGGVGD